ncbi:hypothetical protein DSL72_000231 [Monilinia vaccinii-corymbosi]|uniref:Uncharacterized protein n=1 Tax=Monilinia vaccinii-corymbosi TaxID=61207 RepID=A0A8A3NYQ8_9HELO|nr:hypothetical protein DSL72_000231 [Monilinia vaccinii-corymbosi]
MSSLPKFTFPGTLGGGSHAITSPSSSPSKQKQKKNQPSGNNNNTRCVFIVQAYPCPHHPTLSTPHLLHRTPCPQALLPPSRQSSRCANYGRREGELVQVVRYARERGCMSCRAGARSRRYHEEVGDHAEMIRKMRELGLGGDDDDEGGVDDDDDDDDDGGGGKAGKRIVELVRERKGGAEVGVVGRNKTGGYGDGDEMVAKDSNGPEEMVKTNIHHPLKSHQDSPITKASPTASYPLEKDELDDELLDGILDEWDHWRDENPKTWGEVALAPGFTADGRDEWVVIGSWGEDG